MKKGYKNRTSSDTSPSLIFPLSNDGYFLQEVFFQYFFNIFMFEIVNIFFNIFFNTIFASFNIYSYICIVKIFN
jgi:hypothetical protein